MQRVGSGWVAIALSLAGCFQSREPRCGPGLICTVAGSSEEREFAGDGGPAEDARLALPIDVTAGPDGRLYVVDWANQRIRMIDGAGIIETIAGTGDIGDVRPGPALESDFNMPTIATGLIEHVAGTGRRAYGGNGGPAATADLDLPVGVAFLPDGTLVFMDQANQTLRRIDGAGAIDRFAGRCVAACEAGETPVACPGSDKLACGEDGCSLPCGPGFEGDGGQALDARFGMPFGGPVQPAGRIAMGPGGDLYVADTLNHRVRRIGSDGVIATVAGTGRQGTGGDGGPAVDADLSGPTDVAVAADGTLYIADTESSCVRAVDPDGSIRTAAGRCGVRGFGGDGGRAERSLLDRPFGVEIAAGGDLLIADTLNNRIRRVTLR
jgi:hypothetical protein